MAKGKLWSGKNEIKAFGSGGFDSECEIRE